MSKSLFFPIRLFLRNKCLKQTDKNSSGSQDWKFLKGVLECMLRKMAIIEVKVCNRQTGGVTNLKHSSQVFLIKFGSSLLALLAGEEKVKFCNLFIFEVAKSIKGFLL